MPGRIMVLPGLWHDDGRYRRELAAGGTRDCALFATRSLLESWRRELLSSMPGRALGGGRLMLGTGLAQKILGPAAPRAASPAARRALMTMAAGELARAGHLPALAPAAAGAAMVRELLIAVDELRRGCIPRELLFEYGRNEPRWREIARCWEAYENKLTGAGLADEESLAAAAAARLPAHGRPPAIDSLLVHGFTEFSPSQARLLRALAAAGVMVTILLPVTATFGHNPDPSARGREFFTGWPVFSPGNTKEKARPIEPPAAAAAGINPRDVDWRELSGEGEAALASLVAREIWTKLREDRTLNLSDIALVCRDIGASEPVLAAVSRHGLPLALPRGRSLLGLKSVGLILAALNCVAGDWPRAAVLRVARGVLVNAEAGMAEALARCSARMGVVSTREAWEDLISFTAEAETEESGVPTAADDDAVLAKAAMARLSAGLRLLPAAGTIAQYRRALLSFVAHWELPACWWPGEKDPAVLRVYAEEMRGLHGLFQTLDETARLEAAAGREREWDARSLALELAHIAGETRLPPERGTGGIRCFEPSEIRGLHFRLIFLIGLAEGEFPKRLSDNWLLPEQKRDRLSGDGRRIESRADLAVREELLLSHVVNAAADILYLCWSPVDDRGEPVAPSPFLTRLREIKDPPRTLLGAADLLPRRVGEAWNGVVARGRMLADLMRRRPANFPSTGEARSGMSPELAGLAARVEAEEARCRGRGPLAGLIEEADLLRHLSRVFPSDRPVSVSELEDYAGCPYAFFLRRLLGLDPGREPEEEPSGLELGLVYHRALEKFYRRYGREVLHRERLAEYENGLDAAIADAFAPLAAKAKTVPARRLLAMGRELCAFRLRALLRAEIRAAAAGGGWRTVHCELGFGLKGRRNLDPASRPEPLAIGQGEDAVLLKGKIDRVDVRDGYYAVYDYKLGRVPETKAVLSGRVLQIPIYLLAARMFLPQLAPAGGGYYGLRDLSRRSGLWRAELAGLTRVGTRGGGSIKEDDWDNVLAGLTGRISAAMRGIRRGDFRPAPEDCPSYCPFRPVCRKEAG